MEYYNLADDSTKKAWESFVTLDEKWRKDPANKEKFLASRKAFQKYDRLRKEFYSFSDTED